MKYLKGEGWKEQQSLRPTGRRHLSPKVRQAFVEVRELESFSKASDDGNGRKRLQQNRYFKAGACTADQCWSRSGEQENPPLEGCWVRNDQGKCPEPGSPKGERGRGGGQTTRSLQFLSEFTLRTLEAGEVAAGPLTSGVTFGQFHRSPQQLQ